MVYGHGTEPDPRFSLANERTFLAWARTSLTFLAAAVALEALEVPVDAVLRIVASSLFAALGVICAVQAWLGWVRTERALRENQPLPANSAGLLLPVGIVAGALVLVAGYLLR